MKFSPELLPTAFEPGAQKAFAALQDIDYVLIAGHVNPDGDALGAIAAAGWILNSLGKNFLLYFPTKIPANLRFLPLPGPIFTNLGDLPFAPQAAVYVDCSEARRLGSELAPIADAWPTINVDHHICERGLGSLANYIDTRAAATCQLMAYVALKAGIPLQGELAEAIGLGIITDTGQFTHANSSAAVFALASALESGGLSIPDLGEKLRQGLTTNKLNLWGILFQRIELKLDGKVAVCPLFRADLDVTGCHAEDAEGFADWLRNINGVQIGLFVREIENGQSKFSMRSIGDTNVQAIAADAGGGGHKNAAGGTVDLAPQAAIGLLLGVIAKFL